MLENLGFPVILVGSQRSSDRGSSDAAINMICATQFIINSDFAEVGICMHSSMNDGECAILPGVKSRKFHSSRRDAFQAINAKPYALINTKGKIKIINNKFRKKQDSKIEANYFNEKLKIGILRAHPNLNPNEISNFKGFDGLILEGTGLGHFPINGQNNQILKELKKLSKKIPLVMTSQTIFGRVNMDVYSTGRELQKIVLSGEDMLTEIAFIKLAHLLSKKQDMSLISENLKGEINFKISDEFL